MDGWDAPASISPRATPMHEQQAPTAEGGSESGVESGGDAPHPSRHVAPTEANLEKVASAVMERAASHRAARGGGEDGMGNDGVAGEFYEYLDHTADVQLHAWGANLQAAFEHIVPCMSNYMTDLSTVEVRAWHCGWMDATTCRMKKRQVGP